MPSATFFHLPTEKRETLLRAARHEFARVPFDEASINRIIREAGIPRGSFYMYFQHKEDLFQYVMGLYAQQLVGLFSRLLEEARGDLFSAFQALFQTFLRLRGDAEILEFQNILRCNAGMRQGALFVRRSLPGGHPESGAPLFRTDADPAPGHGTPPRLRPL